MIKIVKKQSNMSAVLLGLMKKKKLSIRALSQKTGIPASTIGSYTTAKKASYNPDHLIKLAEAFDCSLDFLLTGQERQRVNLENLPLEQVFSGYFKIKLEKIIIPDSEE